MTEDLRENFGGQESNIIQFPAPASQISESDTSEKKLPPTPIFDGLKADAEKLDKISKFPVV